MDIRTTRLATASISARLLGWRGRGILSAKGHHYVIDSPLPLGGPNEEVNPIDLLVAALATSALFVCERAAHDQGLPLSSASAAASCAFDARGMTGCGADPALQTVTLRLTLGVNSVADGEALVAAVKSRCPIHATLAKAVKVNVELIIAKPARDARSSGETR